MCYWESDDKITHIKNVYEQRRKNGKKALLDINNSQDEAPSFTKMRMFERVTTFHSSTFYILSPFLFAVYTDELSLCLHSANIGCRLSNMIVNHLLFADDAVVFAHSAKGLQQLLDIFSKFAVSHRVVFNVVIVKSQCLNMMRHH